MTRRDWRDDRDRLRKSIEDAVVSSVIRALEEEGSTVVVLGRPEDEPWLRPDLRRVERWVSVDGIDTAIEVTSFRETGNERANDHAGEVQAALDAALAGDPRRLVVTFDFDAQLLAARGQRGRRRDALDIADAILAVLAEPGSSDNRHRLQGPFPSWASHVVVAVWSATSTGPHRAVMWVVRGGEAASRVDEFIGDRIGTKATQHLGWGRGVLAIEHGGNVGAKELAAGFERLQEPSPWWRVYWTDVGGRAHLVATSPDVS